MEKERAFESRSLRQILLSFRAIFPKLLENSLFSTMPEYAGIRPIWV